MKGAFIAVYGINNIGKSTQTNLLVQRLLTERVRVEYRKYPLYDLNPTGTTLNEILRGKKQHAIQQVMQFFPGTTIKRPSARQKNIVFKNQPLEKSGQRRQRITEEELQMWYSLNRYQADSSIRQLLNSGTSLVAEDYTGTGLAWGWAKGADVEWLKAVNAYLTKPTIEILMDGERFSEAKEEGHLHESNNRLMEKARSCFLELGKKNNWQVVNANQPKDVIHEQIWQLVAGALKKAAEA